jgi:CRP-like cAMP-binding protein
VSIRRSDLTAIRAIGLALFRSPPYRHSVRVTDMTPSPTVSLLALDPELGQLLTGVRLAEARREVIVRTHTVVAGPWDAERLRGAGPEHVGLLVADGLIAREVVLADNVSAELLGPGDVIRPWQLNDPAQLLRAETRWTVLTPAKLAVLDRRFAGLLTHFPEMNAMLIDRLAERAQRMAVNQAICQLNGVHRRLLALFWQLAERWGRVVPQGVAVTLPLSHRLVAELVGARRPTVSTALSQLAVSGELVRGHDETWLLTGDPVGAPTGEAARVIRGRRRRAEPPVAVAAGTVAEGPPRELARTGRIGELHEALEALREENRLRREEFDALREETHALLDRIGSNRARRAASTRRPD